MPCQEIPLLQRVANLGFSLTNLEPLIIEKDSTSSRDLIALNEVLNSAFEPQEGDDYEIITEEDCQASSLGSVRGKSAHRSLDNETTRASLQSFIKDSPNDVWDAPLEYQDDLNKLNKDLDLLSRSNSSSYEREESCGGKPFITEGTGGIKPNSQSKQLGAQTGLDPGRSSGVDETVSEHTEKTHGSRKEQVGGDTLSDLTSQLEGLKLAPNEGESSFDAPESFNGEKTSGSELTQTGDEQIKLEMRKIQAREDKNKIETSKTHSKGESKMGKKSSKNGGGSYKVDLKPPIIDEKKPINTAGMATTTAGRDNSECSEQKSGVEIGDLKSEVAGERSDVDPSKRSAARKQLSNEDERLNKDRDIECGERMQKSDDEGDTYFDCHNNPPSPGFADKVDIGNVIASTKSGTQQVSYHDEIEDKFPVTTNPEGRDLNEVQTHLGSGDQKVGETSMLQGTQKQLGDENMDSELGQRKTFQKGNKGKEYEKKSSRKGRQSQSPHGHEQSHLDPGITNRANSSTEIRTKICAGLQSLPANSSSFKMSHKTSIRASRHSPISNARDEMCHTDSASAVHHSHIEKTNVGGTPRPTSMNLSRRKEPHTSDTHPSAELLDMTPPLLLPNSSDENMAVSKMVECNENATANLCSEGKTHATSKEKAREDYMVLVTITSLSNPIPQSVWIPRTAKDHLTVRGRTEPYSLTIFELYDVPYKYKLYEDNTQIDKDVTGTENVMRTGRTKETTEISTDRSRRSTEVYMDRARGSTESHMDKNRESTESQRDRSRGSTEGHVDRIRGSTEGHMDRTRGSTEGHVDRTRGSTEGHVDRTRGSTEGHMDRTRGSTEGHMDRTRGSTESHMDRTRGSTEGHMDRTRGSTEDHMDRPRGSTESHMDRPRGSTESHMDRTRGSTESHMDRTRGSTESHMDRPRGSTEDHMDRPRGSTESHMDRPRGSTESHMDRPRGSTEDHMDRPRGSTEDHMDRPRGSTEDHMDRPRGSTEDHMDRPRGSTEDHMDRPRGSTEDHMDRPRGSTESHMDRPRGSTESHMDRPRGSTEDHMDRPRGSTEDHMDRPRGSTESHMDRTRGSTESHMDRTRGSTESHMDRPRGSTEDHMDRPRGSTESHMDRPRGSTESHMDRTRRSTESHMDRPRGSTEDHMDRTRGSTESHMDRPRGSTESHMDRPRGSTESHMDRPRGSTESHMDRTRGSTESHMDRPRGSTESHMDSTRGSTESHMDRTRGSTESHMDRTRGFAEGQRERSSGSTGDQTGTRLYPSLDGHSTGSTDIRQELSTGHVSGVSNREYIEIGHPCQVDRTIASTESHMDRTRGPTEGQMYRTTGSTEGHMDRTTGSTDILMDRNRGSSEGLVDRTKESTESHMDRNNGSTEDHMDRTRGSTDSHLDKTRGFTEGHMDRTRGSTDSHLDKTRGFTEGHMDRNRGFTEGHMDRNRGSTEGYTDRTREPTEGHSIRRHDDGLSKNHYNDRHPHHTQTVTEYAGVHRKDNLRAGISLPRNSAEKPSEWYGLSDSDSEDGQDTNSAVDSEDPELTSEHSRDDPRARGGLRTSHDVEMRDLSERNPRGPRDSGGECASFGYMSRSSAHANQFQAEKKRSGGLTESGLYPDRKSSRSGWTESFSGKTRSLPPTEGYGNINIIVSIDPQIDSTLLAHMFLWPKKMKCLTVKLYDHHNEGMILVEGEASEVFEIKKKFEEILAFQTTSNENRDEQERHSFSSTASSRVTVNKQRSDEHRTTYSDNFRNPSHIGRSDSEERERRRTGSSVDRQHLQSGALITEHNMIKVRVKNADITTLKVDAIVNAANARLKHGGGVARAIADKAGQELLRECQNFITKGERKLNVTGTFVSTGGKLPAKHVIHAVGPKWSYYGDVKSEECARDLRLTIFNCLLEANKRGCRSIAIPSISAGKLQYYLKHPCYRLKRKALVVIYKQD